MGAYSRWAFIRGWALITHFHHFQQVVSEGLEGYFRDLGFDQNTVRDPGKRKIY